MSRITKRGAYGRWAEHLRQHDRFTRGDREVEAQISGHIEGEPVVEHFIHAELDS